MLLCHLLGQVMNCHRNETQRNHNHQNNANDLSQISRHRGIPTQRPTLLVQKISIYHRVSPQYLPL
jgi:hypothetical protein